MRLPAGFDTVVCAPKLDFDPYFWQDCVAYTYSSPVSGRKPSPGQMSRPTPEGKIQLLTYTAHPLVLRLASVARSCLEARSSGSPLRAHSSVTRTSFSLTYVCLSFSLASRSFLHEREDQCALTPDCGRIGYGHVLNGARSRRFSHVHVLVPAGGNICTRQPQRARRATSTGEGSGGSLVNCHCASPLNCSGTCLSLSLSMESMTAQFVCKGVALSG